MTNTVYIVDADAPGLAADMNGIAAREHHPLHYIPSSSPELLLEQLKTAPASLVLLHHTWNGLQIAQVLEMIRAATSDIRVIVFTGREPNLPELIECVRFGVCDYWLKSGTADIKAWSRKISMYCGSSAYTLETLSRTSGSVINLLREAETNSGRVQSLEAKVAALQRELQRRTSAASLETRKSVARGLEYAFCISVLAIVFLLLAAWTSTFSAGVIVAIFLVFFLFLQGKIAEAVIDWTQRRASFSASRGNDQTTRQP